MSAQIGNTYNLLNTKPASFMVFCDTYYLGRWNFIIYLVVTNPKGQIGYLDIINSKLFYLGKTCI